MTRQEPLDGNTVHVHIILLLIHCSCQPILQAIKAKVQSICLMCQTVCIFILHLHLCLWHKSQYLTQFSCSGSTCGIAESASPERCAGPWGATCAGPWGAASAGPGAQQLQGPGKSRPVKHGMQPQHEQLLTFLWGTPLPVTQS